jgi:hypothetical protein
MNGPEIAVAAIRKNSREEVRVTLSPWRGRNLFHVRMYVPGLTGEMRPAREGICLDVAQIVELIAALHSAETEARRLGLLPDDGSVA